MKHAVKILGFVCAALIVTALRVSAQTSILNTELLKDWVEMKATIMKLANEMPEDKYAYKSTPAQRDFAQQVLHIAQANVMNLGFLRGKAMPPTINRAARSKAEVLKAMADSFDYGEALIKEQTDQSMLEVVQTNAFLGPSSRARVVYFLIGHTWDIYGQMVVYLRLNGGTPPASQRP
ncbi:MAG: DinB family protein [Vicinamibacterales bacterium]